MTNLIFTRSFSQFLQSSDCIIAKILCRLARKNYHSLMVTDSEINFLTFRNDGTISYLPAGKDHIVNDDGTWKRDGRQNGKPAKVMKKLFHPRVWKYFKDADFECFTNQYKATFNDAGYKFELLPAEKIPFVYDEMKIGIGEGSLSGSCMNGQGNYMDIYTNCESLKILILTNKEGLLCGRSLVWSLRDNITLMDRIYVTQDFLFDKFLQYAVENNLWRKRDYKGYNDKMCFINPAGEMMCEKFTVYTETDFDSYPYIDTFCYGEDGSLNNHSGKYTYNSTGGTRDGDEDENEGQVYDDINGEYIDEEDACTITAGERRYRDQTCHVNNAVNIGDDWYHEDDNNIVCVNGEYYRKDDDDICCIDDEYYLTEDCTYCERDGCYYLSDDCVYCEDDGEDVLRSEAVEIGDKWYHKDSDKVVEINGKYYLESAGVTI